MKKTKTNKLPRALKGIGVRAYRIMFDEDFINSSEHDNSLEKLLSTNPDGVSDKLASKVLMLEIREYKECLAEVERIIRQHME